MNDTTILKICTKCKEEKPTTEFYRNKGRKDGYGVYCKECHKANTDKEKMAAYGKVWAANNKERKAATLKIWRENNKEKIRVRRKEYMMNWNVVNKDKKLAHNRNRHARKINAIGTHTSTDIQNLLKLQMNKCAICLKPIAKGYHVDHIIALINGGSNDKYNLQLLCQPCNNRKHAKDPIEFMQSNGFLL